MYKTVDLNSFSNQKGALLPIEFKDLIPFDVKRTYFCFDNQPDRGGHCHLKEQEFFILLQGSANFLLHDGQKEEVIEMQPLKTGLYVDNWVWHAPCEMSKDSLLVAFSSTNYNPNREDYIEDFDEFLTRVQSKL